MGREFINLFDEWSNTYDQTVVGHDEQYREVFEQYDDILNAVSNEVSGNIIEFGVGTGNLTKRLIDGNRVLGIEPSKNMRELAKAKVSEVPIMDGDFLHFPQDYFEKIDCFVSSYAFHHLTDSEKQEAIQKYSRLLDKNGKIVFADTVFENELAKENMIKWAQEKHFSNLTEDLQREYYTTIPFLSKVLEEEGFSVTFHQLNRFVWLINATKQ